MINKKIIVAVLFCFMLCGCKNKVSTNTPKGVSIQVPNTKVEIYSTNYIYDLIKVENAKITSNNTLINTTKLGSVSQEIHYKFKNKNFVYRFNIDVIDSTPPKVFGNSTKTIEVNYEDNLCNLIMYGDNYDKSPNCVIEGEHDVNKVGTYQLRYIITDSSNNIETFELSLNVVEKSSNANQPNSNKNIYFNDVIKNYESDKIEFGIDVSAWQGVIDFNKVKDAGATFVMIRMGIQTSINSDIVMDKYYLRNIENAKKAGLKVGVYLYSMATSTEESIKQANWIVDSLDGLSLDLPIVFDWESWATWNNFDLSFYDINSIADAFITTIEKNQYKGMLYSSKFYLENIWENKPNHLVWLAHYTDKTSYSGNYFIWQLSNIGRIDGINGDVDINILYNK